MNCLCVCLANWGWMFLLSAVYDSKWLVAGGKWLGCKAEGLIDYVILFVFV